jgi:squalene-hopene/tetraprenyl-beta-curcumene cyclase
LIDRQDADGAWRSDTYGVFKDGPSLTPLVLETLLLHRGVDTPRSPASIRLDAACQKGAAYLDRLVRADGTIDEGPHGLSYPVYTAVFAVRALSRPQMAEFRPARDAWLRFLRQRQLTEELGWVPTDKQYGGWGYSHQIPRKPQPGEPLLPLTESNLSATTFALDALQATGCSQDDPAFRKALVFVKRCQNLSEDVSQQDSAFDDGGFFFIYDDAVRNKAGAAGKDRNGRDRFTSYGSTTADGLRSLLTCGLPIDHPRVQAARIWLENSFRPSFHPGRYAKDREMNRQAVYFYYFLSLAKAFHLVNPKFEIRNSKNPGTNVNWAEQLVEDLMNRQQPDGSWINTAVAVREDDPVVATCLAAQALAAVERN